MGPVAYVSTTSVFEMENSCLCFIFCNVRTYHSDLALRKFHVILRYHSHCRFRFCSTPSSSHPPFPSEVLSTLRRVLTNG